MMVIVMLIVGPPRWVLGGCGEGALDSPEGGAILLIVADDRAGLEADIAAGRLTCPRCGRGVLGGWGCARRRPVRTLEGVRWLRPRRGRCREVACAATHVLLADVCLLRRCDAVEVIGAAVLAATDAGYRRVAEQLGRPAETVRDWLARFRSRGELVAAHFWRWARALDGALLLPNAVGLAAAGRRGGDRRVHAGGVVVVDAPAGVVVGVGADGREVAVDQHQSALAVA